MISVVEELEVIVFVVNFLFQAEDGIRDTSVTGVQTCALPICWASADQATARLAKLDDAQLAQLASEVDQLKAGGDIQSEIGRASCRERVSSKGGVAAS